MAFSSSSHSYLLRLPFGISTRQWTRSVIGARILRRAVLRLLFDAS